MSLNKITYSNKVSLNPQPSVANENKVSDADMNEIKSVVNGACDAVDLLNDNVSAITILLSSDQSVNISSGYTRVKINFNTQVLKVGDKLSFDSTNNQIVVGAGVHHVEISCNVVVKNGSSGLGDRYAYVSINENSNTKAQAYYQNQFATNYNYPLNICPIIASVSENDKIYATVSSGVVETMQVRGASIGRTYLTVKVID